MKLKTMLVFAFLSAPLIPLAAQETPAASNTLDAQFTDVIDKSNRYQDYKVVKIYKLNNLRKNVTDSIKAAEAKLTAAQQTIDTQADEISSLQTNVGTLQSQLATSVKKEEGIELFGSILKKSTFKMASWSIMGVLLLLIGLLYAKFKSSNSITKEANTKLAETEEEFDTHRARALEREQQLRRKLQDEINKNRKAQ